MAAEDIPAVVALQRDCFPAPFPEELLWRAEHLERHIAVFPEGQLVARLDGKVVGSCSNSRVENQVWDRHLSWDETVGGPFLTRFGSAGGTLYGLDVSVHPAHRERGIMRSFYQRRFDLVRQLGLTRYGTAVRMPDLAVTAGSRSPEQYATEVAAGALTDRTLTPMLRVGLTLTCVIREYMQDSESANSAAVLEWRP